MKPSPYRRLQLALARWRARRTTVDGRFPRRTDRAVGRLEAALGYAGREDRVALLEGIAALHAESARRGGGAAAGVRSVEALRRALVDAEPDEALILAQLAEAQVELYAMTDDAGLLRKAVRTALRAAERAPDDPLPRIMVLSSMALLLLRAGSDLDDPELFEEVVVMVEDSLAAGGGSRLHLAQAHRLRYEHDGEAETLARGEAAAREAVTQCEEHGLDVADEYAELAQVLRYRYGETGDPRLAREAVAAAREALDRTAGGDEEHSKRACLLAGALTECHYAGDPEALREAVAVVRAATAAETVGPEAAYDHRATAPAGHSGARGTSAVGAAPHSAVPAADPAPTAARSDVWQIAAAVLCAWADQHEDVGVAAEAERVARTALALAGEDKQRRADTLDTLADVLRCRYLLSGDAGSLDEAIAYGESAAPIEVGPPGDRARRLGNLGVLLLLRHEETGAPADLDAAIVRYGEALALLGDDHPDAGIHFNNLGSALAARTRLDGVDDELDEAIAAGRAAVRGDGPAHQRVLRLSNLGGALYARYTRDGDLADLDEDIDLQREALRLAPPDHPERPGLLSNLATALTERHEALGVRDDLSEALALLEEAMATGPSSPSSRRLATVAGAHGLALHAHHRVTGDQDALERAIASLRTAVGATAPTDPHLPLQLANLAVSLREASAHSAAAAVEAVDTARGALAELGQGRSATSVRGSLLLALAARSDDGDLDEAVTLARRVVADTPPDDPDLSRSLANLAHVLNLRHESTGEADDRAAALDALRVAARTGTGSADVRLHAARDWGRLAALTGDARAAAEAFALGVELLPAATPRRLERPDAQRRLAEAAGLASDAAAMCLACGDPERALSLLELGRGVLLNRRSGIRADLADLHDADADLARRFEELRDALDRLDHPPLPLPAPPSATEVTGRERERRRDLEAELDVVIRRIRTLPGQAGFQRPPSVASLLAEAAHGPVVVVNVSGYRCDALLLTAEGLRQVPLDGLDADELERVADVFHADVVTALDPRAAQDDVDGANERITAALDLLWREVAAPVLAELRLTDRDPRVWWVPTQALCRLPLHAATAAQDASRSPTDGTVSPESLVDRTVSSYTPTVTALHRARARGAVPDRTVAAVVHADVHRPGLPELPAARREARAAADRLGVEPLDLAQCERAVLIDALINCTHLHLALHAVADQDDPGTSRFLLPDLDLTFAEIAARRGGWGRLAYLSACETTYTPRALADEAIHLTSAFLVVGFAGVIGTLWRVPDAVAEATARAFYDALDTARDEPAVALARTARLVRVHYGDAPAAWAAHHHVGV
ncbi:CHAT domain-containing protein [Streptomyces europaeiscabiei]|uniref:CHAT domain-containing protein n=1 Tax=Streptomyces europaeiscabiei TaxID=146819 RepID=UPI0029AFFDE2|nr:CHAT domain-containing protein [Streptomyces europaeiscabiei]MDX2767707.1 CHAT domain-containing protein [Streptomyces europaeiscabiei]